MESYNNETRAYSVKASSHIITLLAVGENVTGRLKAIELTAEENDDVIDLSDVRFSITVAAPPVLIGDINNDGVLSQEDVTALAEIILGVCVPDERTRQAADQNKDNRITIADLTSLVKETR